MKNSLAEPVAAALGDGQAGARFEFGLCNPGPLAPRERLWGAACLGGDPAAEPSEG